MLTLLRCRGLISLRVLLIRSTALVHIVAVVCPVSIVGQWANEVKSKLAANLSIYMYHGSKRYANAIAVLVSILYSMYDVYFMYFYKP
jgi:SNF2 family DNA or RNA helicase